MAKEIQLSQGKVAIVSDEDYERVSQYKWSCVRFGESRKPYAARSLPRSDKRAGRLVLLHRFIMDAPKGMQVDHRNGNTMDNTRENLRLCTFAQNMQNRPPRGGASKYKGVKLSKSGGRWEVCIQQVWVGSFADEIEAAHAYDRAAREKFGEFAWLNFPDDAADQAA